MNQELQNRPIQEDEEIDVLALLKQLWIGRKIIIRTTIIGIILGLSIAFLTPKEYTAVTTLVPQTGDSKSDKLGGLSGLAAMAGFDLGSVGSGTTELSPMVYPQIVKSTPFQLDLMNTPLNFEEANQAISMLDYYTNYYEAPLVSKIKKYTIGLPRTILKKLKDSKTIAQGTKEANCIVQLSQEQEEIRKIIDKNILLEVNSKEGYLTLTSKASEALIAAELAGKSVQLLQQYITSIRIKKAQENLDFLQERYNEKKEAFEAAQANLATFRDRNKNVTSALAQTEEERLQSEYNIAFQVYSELAKQLEQAQIQVKSDTPILTTIQPVQVPLEKSKPNRPIILVIWIFLGIVTGAGIVLGKDFLANLKIQWKDA